MHDVLFLIAGPGNIFLPGRERHAHAVHAGHDALVIFVDFLEDLGRPMRAMMRMLTTT